MREATCRILIVDDSEEDRAAYRRSLTRNGGTNYTFVEAATGEEGLSFCRLEKPDCILLDYNLPDLNGLEFIERLHRENGNAHVPLVMLTGQGNETVAVEALKRGAHDYVVKQLSSVNLPNIIRGAIHQVTLNCQLEERRAEIQRLAEERSLLVEKLQKQTIELREADRRKDEFLAVLAHELRNPLGPIRNATKILSLAQPANEETHAEARLVLARQVAHIGRLVDDLLDVSRIARGKVLLRPERIDLKALLRITAEDHRTIIESAGLQLTLELPNSSTWVNGDPTRLAQVIGNLLHNASKFTDAGGSVALTLISTGDFAIVTVTDTGIGMDVGLLAHVFESFNQAEQSLDRSCGGLGLGLALCKSLVQLHGGQIRASSEGIGKGCQLTITLPLDSSPVVAAAVPLALKPKTSWRVLIIEDNVDAAKTLGTLLRLYGHKPFVTHSGLQGVHVAREFRPDVILCDLGLPDGMDGYAVARAIRNEDGLRSAYLVAVTGYGQDEDIKEAQAAGFDLHLTKPIDPNRLEKLLGTLTFPIAGN